MIGQRKYNNQPVVVGGYRFDSKAEARRYEELCLLQQAGEIANIVVHPESELQRASRDSDGRRHSAIRYVADFSYQELPSGRVVVEDVKGHKTPEFKLKERLFRYRFPDFDFRLIDV
ncbi:MAG: hypothetical protein CYG59_24855 [Chloroflexi bacterium]|nr:MAG: hypothetical protein CYG59_24855 [Chloroflexota bacterium]